MLGRQGAGYTGFAAKERKGGRRAPPATLLFLSRAAAGLLGDRYSLPHYTFIIASAMTTDCKTQRSGTPPRTTRRHASQGTTYSEASSSKQQSSTNRSRHTPRTGAKGHKSVLASWLKFHKDFPLIYLKSGPQDINSMKAEKFATWRAKEGKMGGGGCAWSTCKKDMAALTFFNRVIFDKEESMSANPTIKFILRGIKKAKPPVEDDREGVTELELCLMFKWARSKAKKQLKLIRCETERPKAMQGWAAAMLAISAWGVLTRTTTLTKPESGKPCRICDIKYEDSVVWIYLNRGGQTRAGIPIEGGTKTTGPVWAPAHNSPTLADAWDEFIDARIGADLPAGQHDRVKAREDFRRRHKEAPAFPRGDGTATSCYDMSNWTNKALRSACGKSKAETELYTGSTYRIGAESHLKKCGVKAGLRQLYGRWKGQSFEVYERHNEMLIKRTNIPRKIVGRLTGAQTATVMKGGIPSALQWNDEKDRATNPRTSAVANLYSKSES